MFCLAGNRSLLIVHREDAARPSHRRQREPAFVPTPYLKNLAALALSAMSCSVCKIVQAGIQRWVDEWNNAARSDNYDLHNLQETPIPIHEQLGLPSCPSGPQGFMVLSSKPKDPNGWYIMTAVGFATDESKLLFVKCSKS